jgi:hypothetical protein
VNIIDYGHYVNMVPFFFPFNVRFKFQSDFLRVRAMELTFLSKVEGVEKGKQF